jgi:hypothetical protein
MISQRLQFVQFRMLHEGLVCTSQHGLPQYCDGLQDSPSHDSAGFNAFAQILRVCLLSNATNPALQASYQAYRPTDPRIQLLDPGFSFFIVFFTFFSTLTFGQRN